ncbi:MAG: Anthranilate synthase component 1 [Methanonatronarchaeales archaeon]|nr:Anthranilate synthase component 1 [Methanonatronarchaeales archaeon]
MQRGREPEPSLETYLEEVAEGTVHPIKVEADPACGPVDLYRELPGDRKFLLESADMPGSDAQHSRFSFVGGSPDAVVTVTPRGREFEALTENGERLEEMSGGTDTGDLYDSLRGCMPESGGFEGFSRQVFTGGAVGYVSYDSVMPYIDRDVDEDATLARFFLTSEVVVFDHALGKAYVYETPVADGEETYRGGVERARETADLVESVEGTGYKLSEENGELESSDEFGREGFVESVERAKRHVYDGDVFQVVLSRRKTVERTCSPYDLYRALREINPSPYMYLFGDGDSAVVGASPETLFGVTGDTLRVNPIAGTRRRGKDSMEDEELAREMLNDDKERAEHVMLVDLGRNDVRKVCEPGSVDVTDYMSVLRYSHVQHMESTVEGTLREGMDAFDAARATFPAGTVSGAPKVRAMEIIDDLEPVPRGPYAGGIGYFSWTGDSDFAIIIRTAVFDGDDVKVQAGAGIVQDSDPEREYVETGEKMEAVLEALRRAKDGGES